MSYRPLLVLLMASGLLSCSGGRSSAVKYGVTTLEQLKAAKGEPHSIQTATAQQPQQVLVYADDEKYQVENNVVTTSFRNPTDEESSLLFWRHKFKECVTSYTEIPGPPDAHTPAQMELKCPAQGLSAVYDPHTDAVIRVVEYAQ